MTFKPIELSDRDMEFVELRKISRDEIIAACKIPRLVEKGSSPMKEPRGFCHRALVCEG